MEFTNDNERAISKWHAVICQQLVNIALLIGSIWSFTQASVTYKYMISHFTSSFYLDNVHKKIKRMLKPFLLIHLDNVHV